MSACFPAVGALVVAVEQLGDGVEAERRHAAVLLHGAARRQGRLGRFGRRGRLARRGRTGGGGGRVAVAEPDEGHDDAVHLAGRVGPEPVDEVPPRLQLGVRQGLSVHAVVGLELNICSSAWLQENNKVAKDLSEGQMTQISKL